jgi:hypothetical protein
MRRPIGYFCPDGACAFELLGSGLLASRWPTTQPAHQGRHRRRRRRPHGWPRQARRCASLGLRRREGGECQQANRGENNFHGRSPRLQWSSGSSPWKRASSVRTDSAALEPATAPSSPVAHRLHWQNCNLQGCEPRWMIFMIEERSYEIAQGMARDKLLTVQFPTCRQSMIKLLQEREIMLVGYPRIRTKVGTLIWHETLRKRVVGGAGANRGAKQWQLRS